MNTYPTDPPRPFLERAREVPGWMGDAELWWLFRQAEAIPSERRIVEVGCWLGRATVALALGHPNPADIFVVDHFRGTIGEEAFFAIEGNPMSIFVANMQKLVGWVPQIIVADSVEASVRFAYKSLSLVFIDADHEEEAVVQDIEAWLPRVRLGGVICGHDWLRPSVKKAVEASLGTVEAEASIWFKRLT